MCVKIMIERKFKEGPLPENFQVINEIRRKAMGRKGYIGGETLVGYEHKGVVVVSTWSDLDDWKIWVNGEERSSLEERLAPYLEEPVKIRVFMLAADYAKEAFAKSKNDS